MRFNPHQRDLDEAIGGEVMYAGDVTDAGDASDAGDVSDCDDGGGD